MDDILKKIADKTKERVAAQKKAVPPVKSSDPGRTDGPPDIEKTEIFL